MVGSWLFTVIRAMHGHGQYEANVRGGGLLEYAKGLGAGLGAGVSQTYYLFTDDRCCMFRACLLNNVGFGGSSNDFFLQLMKTFMSSKILYTPDNQHTRKIIERVSGSRN